MRQGYVQNPGLRFGSPLTPMIKALLAANISVFLLQILLRGQHGLGAFDLFFGLIPSQVFMRLHVWQLATYMFLHYNFTHILLNMFALWMFGGELERIWGSRSFLQYYLTTGIGAALIYVLIMPLIDPRSAHGVLIGASGAVFGVLTAYALLFPDRKVLLYFLVPIRVRWVVIGYIAIETLTMWNSDGVGHLAHLGGALVGFLYLRGGRRWFDRQISAGRKRKAGSRFRVVDRDPPDRTDGWKPKKRSRVDEILEKISKQGLDSLTPEEQEILRRASRH